ncbi:DUF7338 family protein [Hoeflea poritis]|uniref:Uncharacterized protein n=1 Tax=Hoeflea poritis TaxID=2993659 RepID=A0ABT4VMS0_9HYPH|nr:hypothetical protein [Hoeflea poritis]MDA4845966.1 hypothetical protein [Hoeflea poritis]
MPPGLLTYLRLAPLGLFFTLFFTLPTAPLWAALSVLMGWKVLPGFLALIHTSNDDLDGGQHQLHWPEASGLALMWQRTRWIWRNPSSGFFGEILGIPKEGTTLDYREAGPLSGRTATRFYNYTVWRTADGRLYFGWRCNWPLFGKWYIKMWFGWRYYDNPDQYKHPRFHDLCLDAWVKTTT